MAIDTMDKLIAAMPGQPTHPGHRRSGTAFS